MRSPLSWIWRCVIFVTLICSIAGSEILQLLSRAHFDFTLKMFTTLASFPEDQKHNVLISPYSVFSLLSMMFLGAGSESLTSAQLRAVLRFNNISYAGVQRAFKEVVAVLDDPYYKTSFQEKVGVLLSDQIMPADVYTRAVDEFYGRAVTGIDFKQTSVLETVSPWLANSSFSGGSAQIQTVEADLATSPVLLLTSQAHFHGRWLKAFDPARTFSKGLFFSESSKRLEVPTMTGRFLLPMGYSADMEARVLELPLLERRVSLFLLLPDHMDTGLKTLEQNLSLDNLRTQLATLKEAWVNVKLPRFRLEGAGDLRTVLMTLGLTDLFDPSAADLTGMDPQGRARLTNLFYSASLVVDESGGAGDISMEAKAAATEQVAPSAEPQLSDKYFEVDHPFVFLVWDYHSAMVLLLGRVVKPEPLLL